MKKLNDFIFAKLQNPIYVIGGDGEDDGGIDRENRPPQNGNPAD